MVCLLRFLANKLWPSSKLPVSPRPASLAGLPVKLTLYITQFLSPASVASFAFTCRSVLEKLGTSCWQAIRKVNQRQELQQLLRLLAIDLPDHTLCCHCLILHQSSDGGHRGKACYEAELVGGVHNYVHKHITFDLIRATMTGYRQGHDYRKLLERFDTKILGHRSIENYPYRHLSLAKIIDGSLLIRVQETLLFYGGLPPRMPIIGRIFICAHVGIVGIGFEARLPKHVQCSLDHDHDVQQCIRTFGVRQCVYCPTEFQIELQDCGNFGTSVVVTKWLDVGEGRTVLDPRWWSRLSTYYTVHSMFTGMRGVYGEHLEDRVPVKSEFTSIRAMFEAERDQQLANNQVDELFQMLDQSYYSFEYSRI